MSKSANPRPVADNEAMAVARSVRSGARKLNLVAQMIRGKKASAALTMLAFNERRISKEVYKVLQSAIANAENNHQLDVDRLVVVEATVGRAFVLKRFHARARGKGTGIEKPYSNLRIVVREVEEIKKVKPTNKKLSAKTATEAKASAPKAKKSASKKEQG
ncbi:MAG: 50S ribosomal protein L22 [Alphaproteobacteria bacterium]|nr:50S ribosomal protein L22 [Alphaproteobacteria bacterium]